MRRAFILILCVFNAFIAAGLLWFVFGSKPSQASLKAAQDSSDMEEISDTERWARASASQSVREAAFHLNHFKDKDALSKRTLEQIDQLNTEPLRPLSEWSFNQAALQTYAGNAASSLELKPLIQTSSNKALPLTLRNTAFRAYIQNKLRIDTRLEPQDPAIKLIDSLYLEPNTLADTALHAEYYLIKNNALPEDRTSEFQLRLRASVSSTKSQESTRITAFEILSSMQEVTNLPLESIYHNASPTFQFTILKALVTTPVRSATNSWLNDIHPRSPQQEQLLFKILERE